MKQYAVIKSNKTGLTLILDPQIDFDIIIKELEDKFIASEGFWGKTTMTLTIEGRALDYMEQTRIVNTITEHSDIQILCMLDSDLNIIEDYKKAFLKYYSEFNNLTGMLHPGSIRNGEAIESEASIIIIGDVFEDAKVISGGNIIVLGELSGEAVAGAGGNTDAVVVAFSMNTDKVEIGGIKKAGKSQKNYKKPAAYLLEDDSIILKPIKKSFLSALKHKKCW